MVFNVNEVDDFQKALLGINEYEAFLKRLNLPHSLKELKINENELEDMAQSFATRSIPGIKNLDLQLARKIFIRAWKGE